MMSFLKTAVLITAFCSAAGAEENSYGIESLPGGFVKADVVSHSYVPNRYWPLKEARRLSRRERPAHRSGFRMVNGDNVLRPPARFSGRDHKSDAPCVSPEAAVHIAGLLAAERRP